MRWGGALPQYAVGHVAAMKAVRDDVATVPRLALCGAVLDGVGIAACAGSARRAAARTVADLAGTWGRMEA
jgi:oxygen-dependent protoporphyrinogen oxidase